MSEPATTAVTTAVLYKILSPLLGAALVTLIVMALTKPTNTREWIAALTSTVASSLFGGAFIVSYFGLQNWQNEYFGLVALGGAFFASGMPGWLLVRWWFYINRDPSVSPITNLKNIKKEIGL